MSNITKTHKVGIFAIFVAAALIASVATFGDNMAYAGGKYKKSNDLEQEMEQEQSNKQNSQCVSAEFTLASCNNLSVQLQDQLGNIAGAQQ